MIVSAACCVWRVLSVQSGTECLQTKLQVAWAGQFGIALHDCPHTQGAPGNMGVHTFLNLEGNNKFPWDRKCGLEDTVLSAWATEIHSYSVRITLKNRNSQSPEVQQKLASRKVQKSFTFVHFYILLRFEMSEVRQGSLGAWPLRLERYAPLALEPKGPQMKCKLPTFTQPINSQQLSASSRMSKITGSTVKRALLDIQ